LLNSSSEYLHKSLKKSESEKIPLKGGVQVLPVQWRKQISAPLTKEDSVDDPGVLLSDIALPGIQMIRTLISDLVLDVLLYMTVKYKKNMIEKLVDECNRLVKLYRRHNPNFKGKISIYGHCLIMYRHNPNFKGKISIYGHCLIMSILVYDVLCYQHNLIQKKSQTAELSDLINSPTNMIDKGIMEGTEMLSIKSFDFDVDHFFGI
jgi:hypothetical protein